MDDARGRRGRRDEPLPTVRDERMTSRRRLTARREREREREQTSACGGRREQREEKGLACPRTGSGTTICPGPGCARRGGTPRGGRARRGGTSPSRRRSRRTRTRGCGCPSGRAAGTAREARWARWARSRPSPSRGGRRPPSQSLSLSPCPSRLPCPCRRPYPCRRHSPRLSAGQSQPQAQGQTQ